MGGATHMAAAARAPQPFFALSSVAPTAELEAWLKAARPGETAIYAAGTDLPREAEGVVLVRGWAARGLVTTNQVRDPGDARRWQFLITKTGGQCPRSPEAPIGGATPQPVQRVADRSDLRKLLSTLRSCAERGLPCPSLSSIADELGLAMGEKGRQRAAHLLRRLERERNIIVERRGNLVPPVVTITAAGRASGKSTQDVAVRA